MPFLAAIIPAAVAGVAGATEVGVDVGVGAGVAAGAADAGGAAAAATAVEVGADVAATAAEVGVDAGEIGGEAAEIGGEAGGTTLRQVGQVLKDTWNLAHKVDDGLKQVQSEVKKDKNNITDQDKSDAKSSLDDVKQLEQKDRSVENQLKTQDGAFDKGVTSLKDQEKAAQKAESKDEKELKNENKVLANDQHHHVVKDKIDEVSKKIQGIKVDEDNRKKEIDTDEKSISADQAAEKTNKKTIGDIDKQTTDLKKEESPLQKVVDTKSQPAEKPKAPEAPAKPAAQPKAPEAPAKPVEKPKASEGLNDPVKQAPQTSPSVPSRPDQDSKDLNVAQDTVDKPAPHFSYADMAASLQGPDESAFDRPSGNEDHSPYSGEPSSFYRNDGSPPNNDLWDAPSEVGQAFQRHNGPSLGMAEDNPNTYNFMDDGVDGSPEHTEALYRKSDDAPEYPEYQDATKGPSTLNVSLQDYSKPVSVLSAEQNGSKLNSALNILSKKLNPFLTTAISQPMKI